MSAPDKKKTSRVARPRRDDAAAELREAFRDRAVVRRPSLARMRAEGAYYHKGYEIRFVMPDAAAAQRVRTLLLSLGFKPGGPYRKYNHVVQPLYGRAAVEWFDPARAGPKGRKARRGPNNNRDGSVLSSPIPPG